MQLDKNEASREFSVVCFQKEMAGMCKVTGKYLGESETDHLVKTKDKQRSPSGPQYRIGHCWSYMIILL